MVGKRYHTSDFVWESHTKGRLQPHPKLSIPDGEWENSHNFFLEGLNNHLHYILVLLNLHSFGMDYECPKSAIFGVKRGGPQILSPGPYYEFLNIRSN